MKITKEVIDILHILKNTQLYAKDKHQNDVERAITLIITAITDRYRD